MATKKGRNIKSLKIGPANDKEQLGLDVFQTLVRERSLRVGDFKSEIREQSGGIVEFINSSAMRNFVKIDGEGADGTAEFAPGGGKVVGVGISCDEVFLTVMDIKGDVLEKKKISSDIIKSLKGKISDISEVIGILEESNPVSGKELLAACVAYPDLSGGIKQKNVKAVNEGLCRVFNTDLFISRESTAVGYGEKNFGEHGYIKNLLYVHSDVGIGAVIKDELIFEADENNTAQDRSYLRPWNQFNMVVTTKDLVDKGVGTSIVNLVGGDVDKITLAIILKAAENQDELAVDMARRSGLALGVRVAYLVNIFNPDTVILGGGIEKNEGGFPGYVEESTKRFLLKEAADKLKMLPATLGGEASSVGAAALCRREMFMEV